MTISSWTAPGRLRLDEDQAGPRVGIRKVLSVVLAGLVALSCAVLSCTTAVAAQPNADARRDADTSMTQRRPSAHPDTVFFANGIRWGRSLESQLRTRRLMQKVTSSSDADDTDAEAGVSIGGLVINDTRTTIGRDFYNAFYSRWSTPEGAENVIVRVREQPRPNLGTRILVEVEDERVFQATLQPRLQQIKKAARIARARANRYLKRQYEPRTRY